MWSEGGGFGFCCFLIVDCCLNKKKIMFNDMLKIFIVNKILECSILIKGK